MRKRVPHEIPAVVLAGVCALVITACASAQESVERSPGHTVTIREGDLTVVLADNSAYPGHREGQNGIASLVHASDTASIFRPELAGLNFEHIFDGQKWNTAHVERFEPRNSAMSIRRLSDTSVQLHQPRSDLHHLESWTTFTVVPPHYVDMEFVCLPHADTYDRGYIGLFWASYIHTTIQKEYYFIGRWPEHDRRRWLGFLSPAHNAGNTVRPEDDARDPSFAEAYPPMLYTNYAEGRYTYPFYYGRRGPMMLALLFEDGVRFSHSPTSGSLVGPETFPAWDFHHIIHDYEVGETYRFKVRLVYKPFISTEDVILEYERWSGRTVERPDE